MSFSNSRIPIETSNESEMKRFKERAFVLSEWPSKDIADIRNLLSSLSTALIMFKIETIIESISSPERSSFLVVMDNICEISVRIVDCLRSSSGFVSERIAERSSSNIPNVPDVLALAPSSFVSSSSSSESGSCWSILTLLLSSNIFVSNKLFRTTSKSWGLSIRISLKCSFKTSISFKSISIKNGLVSSALSNLLVSSIFTSEDFKIQRFKTVMNWTLIMSSGNCFNRETINLTPKSISSNTESLDIPGFKGSALAIEVNPVSKSVLNTPTSSSDLARLRTMTSNAEWSIVVVK
ncbi:hypothetical protein WICPIJ_004608 [Wickerhamomyces pijperi]|uniref:Uncharacterized protein n=1 Tax=Wickerhamomyces pijperi TaxID=599730 RepID=A0A9P8Q527_WICPI|nr:hypothetical protein WICPIJ_004608 [Wickerhamomyces pijperi]